MGFTAVKHCIRYCRLPFSPDAAFSACFGEQLLSQRLWLSGNPVTPTFPCPQGWCVAWTHRQNLSPHFSTWRVSSFSFPWITCFRTVIQDLLAAVLLVTGESPSEWHMTKKPETEVQVATSPVSGSVPCLQVCGSLAILSANSPTTSSLKLGWVVFLGLQLRKPNSYRVCC